MKLIAILLAMTCSAATAAEVWAPELRPHHQTCHGRWVTIKGHYVQNVWFEIDGHLQEFEEWTPDRRVWVSDWSRPRILQPVRITVIEYDR